jgi:hypothetical protein
MYLDIVDEMMFPDPQQIWRRRSKHADGRFVEFVGWWGFREPTRCK